MASRVFWVALLAGVLGSVLSALFYALTTTVKAAVQEYAAGRANPRAARRVDRILEDPNAHARVVGVLRALCDAVFVAAVVLWIADLNGREMDPNIPDTLIAAPIAAAFLWVFGIVVPMAVAAYAGPRLICTRSLMLRVLAVAGSPLDGAGRFVDEIVRRLSGVERKDETEQIQEELISVIEEGEREGAIDEGEREMIKAVVGFRELTVETIMTPRTEIEALECTNELGRLMNTIKKVGHSRIPVYEDSLDRIVGIFYVKDLMRWLAGDGARAGNGKGFDLKSILRPALFVPETKTVKDLMTEMIEKKVHIALVADEYGGTAGLVTIEDIVEEIFGDIKDEYEPGGAEAPEVVLDKAARTADVDARTRIDDVNTEIKPLGVQVPLSEEYDTVGGFVVTTLGRIPARGESFEHEGALYRVLEAKPTHVVKVRVEAREEAGLGSAATDAAEANGTRSNGRGAGHGAA